MSSLNCCLTLQHWRACISLTCEWAMAFTIDNEGYMADWQLGIVIIESPTPILDQIRCVERWKTGMLGRFVIPRVSVLSSSTKKMASLVQAADSFPTTAHLATHCSPCSSSQQHHGERSIIVPLNYVADNCR